MATITFQPLLAADRRPASTRVRLTRRGRAVVSLALVLAIASAFFLLGVVFSSMVQAATGGSTPLPATEQVVVQPGQSLWSIAEAVDPSADPRAVISEIADLNGLSDDAVLVTGQLLLVPAI